MSWVKRRGHPSPSPGAAAPAASTPPVQMYDPNQHSAQSVSANLLHILLVQF